jgi:hypothetical protein
MGIIGLFERFNFTNPLIIPSVYIYSIKARIQSTRVSHEMKIVFIASLAFIAVNAIPYQLTFTPNRSTQVKSNLTFQAIGTENPIAKAGRYTMNLYENGQCDGIPVQTETTIMGECVEDQQGSSKLSCSGGDLVVTVFSDSKCEVEPVDIDILPKELNGLCLYVGTVSAMVTWEC